MAGKYRAPQLKKRRPYIFECKSNCMGTKTELKNDEKLTFTLRMDKKTQDVVAFLQDKTMLSKAGVFKLALMTLYNQQMIQESEIKKKESLQ